MPRQDPPAMPPVPKLRQAPPPRIRPQATSTGPPPTMAAAGAGTNSGTHVGTVDADVPARRLVPKLRQTRLRWIWPQATLAAAAGAGANSGTHVDTIEADTPAMRPVPKLRQTPPPRIRLQAISKSPPPTMAAAGTGPNSGAHVDATDADSPADGTGTNSSTRLQQNGVNSGTLATADMSDDITGEMPHSL